MLINQYFNVRICISCEHLNDNIENEIKKRVSDLYWNKQINNVGFIKKIIKIKSISGGEIQNNTGNTYFNVCIQTELYKPVLEEVIDTTVKEVTSHGFFANEPVQVFVGIDSSENVTVNQKVKVKIVKINFIKNKFIVLGKLVR